MAVDRFLSLITRQVHLLLGTRQSGYVAELLQRYYARRYKPGRNYWATINDFDGDLRFKLDRASYMGSAIFWKGFWSRNELCVLDKMLNPAMVFIDVGANQGEFTVFAAKRVPDGRVLAFEPKESSRKLLEDNLRLNSYLNVTVYDFGLHERSGLFEMYEPDEEELTRQTHIPGLSNEGVATIYRSQNRSRPSGMMRVEPLDEVVVESRLDRLDVIKIDAEGAELPVLRGAYQSLKRYRPAIIMEVNKETFQAAGYSIADIVELLTPLNYEFYLIENYRIWEAWRYGLIGRYGKATLIPRSGIHNLPDLCNILCRCYKCES